MNENEPLLSDDRITLRALEPIDVDTLYRWENDTTLWRAGVTLAPFSRKQLWDYINNYDGDIFASKQLRLMIDITDANGTHTTVGAIDLFDFDPVNSRCAVGILIVPPYQRCGYGSAAMSLIEKYCYLRLSLHQLYSIVADDNTPSRGLFEKSGFKISGRLKSWLRTGNTYSDAYIYQKLI